MTGRDNGRAAEKTGFAEARGVTDVDKEDSRYQVLTVEEAILTNVMATVRPER